MNIMFLLFIILITLPFVLVSSFLESRFYNRAILKRIPLIITSIHVVVFLAFAYTSSDWGIIGYFILAFIGIFPFLGCLFVTIIYKIMNVKVKNKQNQ